jgi:hypothetical protein
MRNLYFTRFEEKISSLWIIVDSKQSNPIDTPQQRLLFKIFLALLLSFTVISVQAADLKSNQSWEKFREAIPGHFQDWILDGDGPDYTLIYSEPPPAFDLNQYGDVLQSTFSGYKNHSIKTRSLGFNGQVKDIVVELHYENKTDELETELQNLSRAIYGTGHGARFLKLKDLVKNSVISKPPKLNAVSSIQLQNWLYEEGKELVFVSPESGRFGSLNSINELKLTGRFLSEDNSLVVLNIDSSKIIDFDIVGDIRKFVIDSDYYLGGVVDQSNEIVTLIARSRQVSLITMPALRVEDIANAITSKDKQWAQSYDRNSPGAGKNNLNPATAGDWAPSFLSSELLDTEFGSLLNISDAYLKSQSLSNSVKYHGYQINKFPNPPYKEGVFDRLGKQTQLSSLVFNFNTLGAGHWLETEDQRNIYSLNSLGSFSVTYSPNTTGNDSEIEEAQSIHKAEQLYEDWFREQRNFELVRTVQYMGIYQLFGEKKIGGIDLYSNQSMKFSLLKQQIKTSVRNGLTQCLDQHEKDEAEVIEEIDKYRFLYSLLNRFNGEPPVMPKTIEQLKTKVEEASVAIRYDGNLFGSEYQRKINEYETIQKQVERREDDYQRLATEYFPIQDQFLADYKTYEGPKKPVYEGDVIVSWKIGHNIPSYLESAYKNDESKFDEISRIFTPAHTYRSKQLYRLQSLESRIIEIQSKFGSVELLIGALSLYCNNSPSGSYINNVLKSFASLSDTEKSGSKYISSIATPSIVISRGKETGVGGHNIEVQNFRVATDASISPGSYRYNNGKLTISPKNSGAINDLTMQFSRATDAAPNAQQKLFDKIIKNSPPSPVKGRIRALGIAKNHKAKLNLAHIESAKVARSFTSEAPARDIITFGRSKNTGRLFLERSNEAGIAHRTSIYGSNLTPEIIMQAAKTNPFERVMRVRLDKSLTAEDASALVANYKNATRQISGSSGGGKIPPNRWTSASTGAGGNSGKPRMVIFEDPTTNRKRALLETDRGSIELLVSRNTDARKLLKSLETKIEVDASIELVQKPTIENGMGTKISITDLTIIQAKPISARVAAKFKLQSVNRKLLEKVGNIYASAFRKVKADTNNSGAADYFIEINRQGKSLEEPILFEAIINEPGMRVVRLTPIEDSGDTHKALVAAL